MKLPDIPDVGSRPSRKWVEDLYAYLRSITPFSSTSIRVDRTANGYKSVLVNRRSEESDSIIPDPAYPFRPTLIVREGEESEEGEEGGEERFLNVEECSINGVPVTIGGVSLLADPPPELPIPAGDRQIYVEVSFDDSLAVVSAEVLEAEEQPITTSPVNYVTPSLNKLILGLVFVGEDNTLGVPQIRNNLTVWLSVTGQWNVFAR